MFDVQARQGGEALEDALGSISAYYRRVTTDAHPMPWLIVRVMLAGLGGTVAEIVRGEVWPGGASLLCAGSAIGLAISRTVKNAKRLGLAQDVPEARSRLARSILRDHQFCFVAVMLALGLQLL